jgi:DNA-binding response OmpR family regulator
VEQNLIVISKSAEIRKSFVDSYSLLGYELSAFEDIYEPVRDLNLIDPDHVILDIDGLDRKWKILTAGLRLAQKKITVILLASTVTLEEANEALILGVSGIIIKPFLPEFHLKRVYDIIHRRLRMQGKRIYPRFYAGEAFEGELSLFSETENRSCSFDLVNISEIGAAMRAREPAEAPELKPGYVIEEATLRINRDEFPICAEVVFRSRGLVGVKFRSIKKNESSFTRFIQILSLKAFGISGLRGKW